ncbi:response regulator, partial [Actinoallomurus sp. NPDC052274]
RRGLPLAVSVPPGPGRPGGPAFVAVGGPPPAPPSYGGGPMPVPEWLGGAPGAANPPRFLPPTG